MSGFRLPVITVIVFYKVVHLNLEVLVQPFDKLGVDKLVRFSSCSFAGFY
jgi:hypothetical protein